MWILTAVSAMLWSLSPAHACPPQRLEPPTPWYIASYGRSVVVADGWLFVGDSGDATLCPLAQNCGNGAAHVYRLEGAATAWSHTQTLFASDIDEYYNFGRSMAEDGGRLIVGASGSDLGGPEAGAAYVFQLRNEQWTEVGRIAPVEPASRGGFALRVAICDGTAVIGQPKYSACWIYEETAPDWTFRQKLPDPSGRGSEFGAALAMTDDWIFVGAPEDEEFAFFGGAVHVYRREPGGMATRTQKLVAPDVLDGPLFGYALSATDDTLAVGAPLTEAAKGAVHLFKLDGAMWAPAGSLAEDGTFRLGESVSMSGDTLVSGARGALHVYRPDGSGAWTPAGRLTPDPFTGAFGFAAAVATDGRWVVTGAMDETVGGVESSGAAYVFDLACSACRVDLDGDGELTFFDFLAFQNLFAAGDPQADFDGDGELTFFDFLAFQNEYAAGC